MQLKIYQRLNQLLLLLLGSLVLFVLIIVFNYNKLQDHKMLIFILFMLYSLGAYFFFKMLEVNWDKQLIQKMTAKGQVALANIRSAKPYLAIKDSSGKRYVLWEITADVYDSKLNRTSCTFYEKINRELQSIPLGSVFITEDPARPNRHFIIPNLLISHNQTLIPLVSQYEQAKALNIKYLNVYYKDGIVLETFKESLKKQNSSEKEG